jgi:DNA-binding PadR family transcriptional regulator
MQRQQELQFIRVGLMSQITHLQQQLAEVDAELRGDGKPVIYRRISAEGRERVAEAQRQRWAKLRQEKAAKAATDGPGAAA